MVQSRDLKFVCSSTNPSVHWWRGHASYQFPQTSNLLHAAQLQSTWQSTRMSLRTLMSHISLGTVPVRSLSSKKISSTFLRFASSDGIVPVSPHLYRKTELRVVRRPSSVGIVPPRLADPRSSCSRLENSTRSGPNVPVNLLSPSAMISIAFAKGAMMSFHTPTNPQTLRSRSRRLVNPCSWSVSSPSRAFLSRKRSLRRDMLEISVDSVPVNLLLPRFSVRRLLKLYRFGGIGPSMALLLRSKSTILGKNPKSP
mmetsp:Transcript_25396/g.37102  ORF Transcript_25396/g.37102 Transcript_25396/m.37102 type:complete len:255 (+) Transcript_25396:294-1058(+)